MGKGLGTDTWFGGGGTYEKDGKLFRDELFGDTQIGSKVDISKYTSDNKFANAPAFKPSIDSTDIGADKGLGGSNLFGGEDSVMGMGMGEFAIGAGQLALGVADFFGKQEYNDAAIDSMKASTKLTQDQYKDFKNYQSDTKQAWA